MMPLERIIATADRHSALFAVVGGIGLVLSSASYAGFIRLPRLEILSGIPAVIASVIYNGVWWGFVYPKVEEMRKNRKLQSEGASGNG
jgi:uncharacterized membrane protein